MTQGYSTVKTCTLQDDFQPWVIRVHEVNVNMVDDPRTLIFSKVSYTMRNYHASLKCNLNKCKYCGWLSVILLSNISVIR